eukprot:scaffold65823_cov24-Tisochrysis_lutea.AAC.1
MVSTVQTRMSSLPHQQSGNWTRRSSTNYGTEGQQQVQQLSLGASLLNGHTQERQEKFPMVCCESLGALTPHVSFPVPLCLHITMHANKETWPLGSTGHCSLRALKQSHKLFTNKGLQKILHEDYTVRHMHHHM